MGEGERRRGREGEGERRRGREGEGERRRGREEGGEKKGERGEEGCRTPPDVNQPRPDINVFRCYEAKIEESEKAGSCRELNPGHNLLEPQQPDNHRPSQSSICI